jgi:hypothetical protein
MQPALKFYTVSGFGIKHSEVFYFQGFIGLLRTVLSLEALNGVLLALNWKYDRQF